MGAGYQRVPVHVSYNKKVLAADALSRDPRFDNVPPEPMSRKDLMPRGALDPLDQPEWEPEPGDLATGMCGSARFAAEQPGGIDGLHTCTKPPGRPVEPRDTRDAVGHGAWGAEHKNPQGRRHKANGWGASRAQPNPHEHLQRHRIAANANGAIHAGP